MYLQLLCQMVWNKVPQKAQQNHKQRAFNGASVEEETVDTRNQNNL